MSEHFFYEWVEYRNEKEKIEALEYLNLWIKFFTRKLPEMNMVGVPKIVRKKIETFDEREYKSTLGVKIHMKVIK